MLYYEGTDEEIRVGDVAKFDPKTSECAPPGEVIVTEVHEREKWSWVRIDRDILSGQVESRLKWLRLVRRKDEGAKPEPTDAAPKPDEVIVLSEVLETREETRRELAAAKDSLEQATRWLEEKNATVQSLMEQVGNLGDENARLLDSWGKLKDQHDDREHLVGKIVCFVRQIAHATQQTGAAGLLEGIASLIQQGCYEPNVVPHLQKFVGAVSQASFVEGKRLGRDD
jgi:hypothetical protein